MARLRNRTLRAGGAASPMVIANAYAEEMLAGLMPLRGPASRSDRHWGSEARVVTGSNAVDNNMEGLHDPARPPGATAAAAAITASRRRTASRALAAGCSIKPTPEPGARRGLQAWTRGRSCAGWLAAHFALPACLPTPPRASTPTPLTSTADGIFPVAPEGRCPSLRGREGVRRSAGALQKRGRRDILSGRSAAWSADKTSLLVAVVSRMKRSRRQQGPGAVDKVVAQGRVPLIRDADQIALARRRPIFSAVSPGATRRGDMRPGDSRPLNQRPTISWECSTSRSPNPLDQHAHARPDAATATAGTPSSPSPLARRRHLGAVARLTR